MVIRIRAVPDSLLLHEFDAVFRAVLSVHGQEFHSFRRATRSRTLREFQLRPTETFLYTCGAIDLWEREMRLLDEQPGSVGDDAPLCLGGRGAAPPPPCGGPTGYRLMLKRQSMGEAMCTPVPMEAVLGVWTASDPDAPPETWRSYRQILQVRRRHASTIVHDSHTSRRHRDYELAGAATGVNSGTLSRKARQMSNSGRFQAMK
jgi:hypothetical protein